MNLKNIISNSKILHLLTKNCNSKNLFNFSILKF